jgi:hypothetical protein
MDIWYSSWKFGIFFSCFTILHEEKSGNPGIVCGNLEYFSRFGILYEEKSGNPGSLLVQI